MRLIGGGTIQSVYSRGAVNATVGGAGGLGSLLALTQSSGNADQTYAIILFLGILGVTVSRLIVRSQRRVIFWSDK